MIERIESLGPYIHDCTVPGERREDGAWPAMADVTQLSRDRWLVLYSTRGWLCEDQGFRGNDNDRGIIYQIRKDGPLGPVIKEAPLALYREDWDPERDGARYLMQHCHSGCFGVPLGALIRGRRVAHENLFVATWYRQARLRGSGPDGLAPQQAEEELFDRLFGVQWTQFRLRDDGGDIDIVQPPQPMRQKGYETGEAFCSVEPRCAMNQWYVKPAALNDDMSEWVKVPHFSRGIASIRLRCNSTTGLYEWVETGPLLELARQSGLWQVGEAAYRLTETSVIRHRDGWLVAARSAEANSKRIPGTAWIRTDDLFKALPAPTFPGSPRSNAPTGVFRCADGTARIFTGDASTSPYRNERDPLYVWDADLANGCTASNVRVAFDPQAAGMAIEPNTELRVDMPNLVPHAGGREQWLLYRVRLRRTTKPWMRITEDEKWRTALHHSRIVYHDDYPPAWEFAPGHG